MTIEGCCQACRKWIAVRRDGTLRGHGASTLYDNWCPGALTAPTETRPRAGEPRGQGTARAPWPFDLIDTEEL